MRVISVNSFKGGTAKTSTTLHIAASFAKFHKKKVLLIDFDPQANLTTGLGMDPDDQDSLAPVLQGEKDVLSVIKKTCVDSLDIIPSDTWLERIEVTGALASNRYSHERLKEIVSSLKKYDYILIDTPPSICWLTESALIAANKILICATPDFYSIKGIQKFATFISSISERHSLEVLGIVLSFWNKRGKNNLEFKRIIEETLPGKLLNSKIRRDIAISEASIYGKPIFEVAPKARASQDYRELSKELLKCL